MVCIIVLHVLALCGFGQQSGAAGGQEWEVSGSIQSEHKPLRNIFVVMEGPQRAWTRTDSQGAYVLKGTVGGTYRMVAQRPESAHFDLTKTLSVLPGQKLSGVNFLFRQGGVLAGRVSDGNGPVAGLIVAAMRNLQRAGRQRVSIAEAARTNDLGEYRIANVPDGSYTVAVVSTLPKRLPLRKKETREAPRSFPAAYPPFTFSPNGRELKAAYSVELRSGETRTDLDIRMEKYPVRCLSFKVDAGSADLPNGAVISASVSEWLGVQGGETAAEGRVSPGEEYEVCGLPAGEYRVSLFSHTLNPFRGLGYARVPAIIGKQDVGLGSILVKGVKEMRGRVSVRESGSIPAQMRVTLVPWNRSMIAIENLAVPIEANGTFAVQHVYPGVYGIEAGNLPARYYITRASQDGSDALDAGVLTEGGDILIELAADGPSLAGRVIGEKDAAVADATVFLIGGDGDQVRTAQSDQHGAYRVESGLPPGEYKIVAVSDLLDTQRGNEVAGRYLSRAVNVKLSARENKNLDLKVVTSIR